MATLPRLLKIGAGTRKQVPSLLRELRYSKPLIVTDSFLAKQGCVGEMVDNLEGEGFLCSVFLDTVPDPTDTVVNEVCRVVKEGDFDCIIGLGGGSPIDTAKAAAVLSVHGGHMRDYKVPNNPPNGLPVIALPTTAGTGSEVTKATVITDQETQEKMLCMANAFQPVAAVVDYEYTLSKPFRLTADTGLDSLTHAIEAYVSKKANVFTDAIALDAIRAIHANIRTACFEPTNRLAREQMMLGSLLGGMAFSNASVALVHGMARPLGAHFHVAHGLSNAMLLSAVTRFSAPSAVSRYASCARAMTDITPVGASDAECTHLLLEELEALKRDLKVPTPKEYGIDGNHYKSMASTMARQALASGSPMNNPRVPSEEEIVRLYEECFQ